MKKSVAVYLVLAGLLGLSASAQNLSLDYTITVRVASDPIDLQGITDTVSFGVVGFGQSVLSNGPGGQPRSTINNDGYATINYTARAEITSGLWTLGSTPGNNTAVLYGIFTQAVTPADDAVAGRYVASGDFGTEDRLTGSAKTATATILAQDSESNVEMKGYNVFSTQSFRSLRYRLDTPTSGDMNQQVITITIGAVIS